MIVEQDIFDYGTIKTVYLLTYKALSRIVEVDYWLHHGLGLAGRVVRPKVLILLHLLLHCQQLRLQLVAEARQSVADVVCQLLVQRTLQIWRSHPVGHVTVSFIQTQWHSHTEWKLTLDKRPSIDDWGQTDSIMILALVPTPVIDFDFLSSASYGHDPYTRNQHQGLSSGVQNTEWKQMDRHNQFYYFFCECSR